MSSLPSPNKHANSWTCDNRDRPFSISVASSFSTTRLSTPTARKGTGKIMIILDLNLHVKWENYYNHKKAPLDNGFDKDL